MQDIFPSVMEDLSKRGLIEYVGKRSEAVVTAQPAIETSQGTNVAVKDRQKFENHRIEVADFCDFILADGVSRFPEIYKKIVAEPSPSQVEEKNIQPEVASEGQKRTIIISADDGIYCNKESKKPNYAIKGKKRTKLINALKGGKVTGSFLADHLGQDLQTISKEVGKINELFRKNLQLQNDLIVRVETGGYKLNREKFDIQFESDL
jgi:hypothetical protein